VAVCLVDASMTTFPAILIAHFLEFW